MEDEWRINEEIMEKVWFSKPGIRKASRRIGPKYEVGSMRSDRTFIRGCFRLQALGHQTSGLTSILPIPPGTDIFSSTKAAHMNPNKALWEKGDFTRIAATMRDSGAELVAKLGITPGMEVLDLGCGDGTTAIPAAKLGANVLGVDIASNLVEAGNMRVKKEKLTNCKFQEGDATGLHDLKDERFDLVISIFGAMFAPKPFDVASEMVRVTKRGGRIVMGNWIPGDPTLVAQILKVSSAYTPPPPEGFISPMTWGMENHVIERFGKAGIAAENISFDRDTFTFNAPYTPTEFVAAFKNYYGPTMNAFEAAEKNGKAADLQGELETLFNSQNTSTKPNATSIPATFLRVTVRR
jgi:ubiquinone/menaquinone biosynthesis C-methylase UbiE